MELVIPTHWAKGIKRKKSVFRFFSVICDNRNWFKRTIPYITLAFLLVKYCCCLFWLIHKSVRCLKCSCINALQCCLKFKTKNSLYIST